MGFKPSEADECLLIKRMGDGRQHVLAIHVDDIYSMAPDKQARERFEKELSRHLEIKHQYDDVTYLAMRIRKREDGTVVVDQQKFAEKIIERFNVTSKPLSTPARPDLIAQQADEEEEKKGRYAVTPLTAAEDNMGQCSVACNPYCIYVFP
eukprot:scaffold9657_cov159-Ochromonas_danica.AAC.1